MDSLSDSGAEINTDDLEYRGEGNSSLVVALKNVNCKYVRHLPNPKNIFLFTSAFRSIKKGFILRIKKCPENSSSQNVNPSLDTQTQIDFNLNVLQHLFQPIHWIDSWQSIALTATDLKEIDQLIKPFRQGKHELNLHKHFQKHFTIKTDDFSASSVIEFHNLFIFVRLRPCRSFQNNVFTNHFPFKAVKLY